MLFYEFIHVVSESGDLKHAKVAAPASLPHVCLLLSLYAVVYNLK